VAVDRSDASPDRKGLPITYGMYTEESTAHGRSSVRAGARPLKTSEVIATDLVKDIVSRGLQVGDRLPDEAAMLVQYGVSRESLREALRILEVQGLISIRRGPGGGPQVAGVDPAYLARNSSLYFHLCGATYDEVFETWIVLEPAIAEKVASLPDRALVRAQMAPFIEPSPDDVEREKFLATSNGFHACLAELSGNRVLSLLMQSISHIVVDHVILDLDPIRARDTIEHDHREIAEAISAGRGSRARKLMAEHATHVRDTYRSLWPERMLDLVEWR
jgi:GntR family transcriptional repressor for pyruvate dehydrogenase complex